MKKLAKIMLSILLTICLALSSFLSGCGCKKILKYQDFVQEDFKELPVVRIQTENNFYPVSKEEYVNCSFVLENAGEYNFEVSMKESATDGDAVGIRRRGHSTYSMPKVPFRIKFNKKKSLFGLEKAKSWVLLADYLDQSSIRNYTAFSMANYFEGLSFTPHPNHVILFLNDEYMGLYLLVEQIDENKGRTGVEKDFEIQANANYPFLVEMSSDISADEKPYDVFNINGFQPFEIKYPEYTERGRTEDNDPVFDYIKDYITAITQTISNHNLQVSFNGQNLKFSDLVDENSFIDYMLVNELMLNLDNIWKSVYFHKSINGKVKFGPIWDFDFCLTDVWTGEPYKKADMTCAYYTYQTRYNWFFKMYLQDETNYQKVQTRWSLASSKLADANNGVSALLTAYKQKIIDQAICDAKYWYGSTGEKQFETQYNYVQSVLVERISFLNTLFGQEYQSFANQAGVV